MFNSDSETDLQSNQHSNVQKQSPMSPSFNKSKKRVVPVASPEQSTDHQQAQQVKQKRFVRISSIVNDIETLQQMEINDHQQRLMSNEQKPLNHHQPIGFQIDHNQQPDAKQPTEQNKNSSASSSIESIENKDQLKDLQVPKASSSDSIAKSLSAHRFYVL